MSEKQKMGIAVDLPTSILASLFAALMFTGIHKPGYKEDKFSSLPFWKTVAKMY